MKIIWSPLALERVAEIADYIRRDNPSAARKWVVALFKKVKSLEKFPARGRYVPEIHRQDIREIIFPPYRVIYRLDDNQIAVLTLRHSKQRFSFTEVR